MLTSKKYQNSIFQILVPLIFLLLVIIYMYSYKFDGNITGFFRIGAEFPKSPYLDTTKALIFPEQVGMDGQMFLTIAFDPFLKNPDTIQALDIPDFRYRRILYPLLGYILGLGKISLIPYAMVAINCICVIAIVLYTKAYLKLIESPPWQSILVFCIPSVWIILYFSTAGLLSSALLVSSLYYYQTQKTFLSVFLIGLACFARETILIVVLSYCCASLLQKKWKEFILFVASSIPWLCWNFYIVHQPKLQKDVDVFDANFSTPFKGITNKFDSFLSLDSPNELYELYSFLLFCLIVLVLFYAAIKNIYFEPVVSVTAFAYITIFVFTVNTYDYLGYIRIFIDVYLLLLLSHLRGNNFLARIKLFLFMGTGLASLAFIVGSS